MVLRQAQDALTLSEGWVADCLGGIEVRDSWFDSARRGLRAGSPRTRCEAAREGWGRGRIRRPQGPPLPDGGLAVAVLVVGGFFDEDDVVGVAFVDAGVGDADEAGFGLHGVNVGGADVAHG